MRKPVVNYRKLRFSNIHTPEFSHLLLLLGWVGYFAAYFITENFIPAEACYVIHSPLDDWIPFSEIFVIPYVFWYLLVAGSLLYFALYHVESFRNLMKFIIVTQIAAMVIYILFPNRQDLRPETFARDNILTRIVGLLYAFDTNTNVCPSLHVGYSIALVSVWLKKKDTAVVWKLFVVVAAILICMSTCFIKQHSVVDFFAALPICMLAEVLVYRKYWFKSKA